MVLLSVAPHGVLNQLTAYAGHCVPSQPILSSGYTTPHNGLGFFLQVLLAD